MNHLSMYTSYHCVSFRDMPLFMPALSLSTQGMFTDPFVTAGTGLLALSLEQNSSSKIG